MSIFSDIPPSAHACSLLFPLEHIVTIVILNSLCGISNIWAVSESGSVSYGFDSFLLPFLFLCLLLFLIECRLCRYRAMVTEVMCVPRIGHASSTTIRYSRALGEASQEFNGIGFIVTKIIVRAPPTSDSSSVACGWVGLWCQGCIVFIRVPAVSSVSAFLTHLWPRRGLSARPRPSPAVGHRCLLGTCLLTRCSLEVTLLLNAIINCVNYFRFYNPLHNNSSILHCFSTPSRILAKRQRPRILLLTSSYQELYIVPRTSSLSKHSLVSNTCGLTIWAEESLKNAG